MSEQERGTEPLDQQRLNRMKLKILGEVNQNLRTRYYSSDQMVDRIRKIIEQEANP